MYNDDFAINRRGCSRENTRLPAQYFIKNRSVRYLDCTIVNLSRSGAGILFPSGEALEKGAPVFLDVVVPKSFEQLTLRGEIQRARAEGAQQFGGVKFDAKLPHDLFARLVAAESA